MLTRLQPDFNTYHNEPPQLDPNKFNRPLKSSRKRDELSAPTGLGSSSGANVLCVCSLLGLSSKKPVDLFKRDCDHTHITLVIPDLWQLVSIFKPASVTSTTTFSPKTNELIFRPQKGGMKQPRRVINCVNAKFICIFIQT